MVLNFPLRYVYEREMFRSGENYVLNIPKAVSLYAANVIIFKNWRNLYLNYLNSSIRWISEEKSVLEHPNSKTVHISTADNTNQKNQRINI